MFSLKRVQHRGKRITRDSCVWSQAIPEGTEYGSLYCGLLLCFTTEYSFIWVFYTIWVAGAPGSSFCGLSHGKSTFRGSNIYLFGGGFPRAVDGDIQIYRLVVVKQWRKSNNKIYPYVIFVRFKLKIKRNIYQN
jgi:hypothetical protein